MLGLLKRLTLRHWGLIHFKFALGVMWVGAMLLFTPAALGAALQQPLIGIWTTATLIGGIISIAGIILSVSVDAKSRVNAVWIELLGLVLLAVGPFTYMLAQWGIEATNFTGDRIALGFFAYAMLAAILSRVAVVLPRFHREGHDDSKDV